MEENKEEVIEKEEVVEVQEDTTKQELEEMTDRYKRLMAEFDNFKKRSSKERESLYNSLMSDIITSILPVVDNLEKAAAAPRRSRPTH